MREANFQNLGQKGDLNQYGSSYEPPIQDFQFNSIQRVRCIINRHLQFITIILISYSQGRRKEKK